MDTLAFECLRRACTGQWFRVERDTTTGQRFATPMRHLPGPRDFGPGIYAGPAVEIPDGDIPAAVNSVAR